MSAADTSEKPASDLVSRLEEGLDAQALWHQHFDAPNLDAIDDLLSEAATHIRDQAFALEVADKDLAMFRTALKERTMKYRALRAQLKPTEVVILAGRSLDGIDSTGIT